MVVMNNIEISIIVPVYNVEQFIEKCVYSLVNQKFDKPYEILLIDDGSSDNSGVIADECARKFKVVKTFHKENGGLSSARNYGMNYALGGYVTFVDSDDYVSDCYLADLYAVKEKYKADIILTKICLMTEEETKKRYEETIRTEVLSNEEAFWQVYIQKKVSWSACAKLMKKDILLQHRFPDGYYEDSASMYLYLSEADCIVMTDLRNNYHYIRRDGSITASKLSNKHMRIFEVCDEIAEYINVHYKSNEYIATLIYQNAVLQLLTRIKMDKREYASIFNKTLKMSRANIIHILTEKKVGISTKCYSLLLCTSPSVFRLCRSVFVKLKLIKGDWN